MRVCSVARYSTEEQRRQSIAAQHRFNRAALEATGAELDWFEVSDEGVSGELKERPGILQLRKGIEAREWDLIICEDSSRLYRNVTACLELVGLAVDHKVRVICIGDNMDTAENDWQPRLLEAQNHHCQDNSFTRSRIHRALDDLWENGAAMWPLRPGYRRRAKAPATAHQPAQGPYLDEIAPEWAPVIVEAFERIAGVQRRVPGENGLEPRIVGEPTWSVAKWLTKRLACQEPTGALARGARRRSSA